MSRKHPVLPIKKYPSPVLSRNVMLHLVIQYALYRLSNGHLREVKNNKKFQTFSSNSDRDRLREVVAHKRF